MRISKHFSLAEFTRSQTATRRGIDNTPTPSAKINMRHLCKYVLEPLREEVGAPIFISSGYRCAQLNGAIGGSATSQHMEGKAADIIVTGWTPREVCDWIYANLEYDQLIMEFFQWTHVSFTARAGTQNRNEYLDATSAGYSRVS